MPKFVALLRGINVGTAKRVAMAELRKLCLELGYANVVTLLNSGNVVFTASKGTALSHARAMAAAIATKLKVEAPVIVLSEGDFNAVVAENSLVNAAKDPSRLLVAFVQEAKSLAGISALATLVKPPEKFAVGGHAAYLWCPNGILQSKAGKALLGPMGKLATTRNWATVMKLNALLVGAKP